MKDLKAIIVEDELPARNRIKGLLQKNFDIFNSIIEASNFEDAFTKLSQYQFDIVFLDIQLKDKNAFDLLEKVNLSKPTRIIFTTAYDQYAVRAFEALAYDYLLKPFKDERFIKVIKRIIEEEITRVEDSTQLNSLQLKSLIEYIESLKKNEDLKKIPIKISNRVYFIDVYEINYISASGYYAEIYIDKQKHLVRESLTNLIKELPSDKFKRIHRSTIINMDFIKELISVGYGDYELKMNDGRTFRISKTYKADILENLGI
ncbi:MAG: response regulator transcription factor [Balneolaceae bacterium]|nr:response regulator transcription factor [Balneolaceae bacterium]MBO6547017.1 response regulator transcription factor [Balneolaceae bacterium]MBO6648036.1 response regulator transcription factor [Balneolaceae bacterium]